MNARAFIAGRKIVAVAVDGDRSPRLLTGMGGDEGEAQPLAASDPAMAREKVARRGPRPFAHLKLNLFPM